MPPSKSDVHETPDRVFEMIENQWGYTKEEMFDPCPVNPKFDGLYITWKDINFVNPPYGNNRYNPLTLMFVEKAITEASRGHKSIMLLPSKTDQQWFHQLVRRSYKIKWIQGRLSFKNDKWSATQPHFLVLIK